MLSCDIQVFFGLAVEHMGGPVPFRYGRKDFTEAEGSPNIVRLPVGDGKFSPPRLTSTRG